MSNNDIYQKPQEIITEINMSDEKIPWLIIEGKTDYNFLITKKLPNNPKTIPVNGWESVCETIDGVVEQKISDNVFGFIDRDYREELNIVIKNKNIIVETDYRDIEISIFESEALEKVLREYGSHSKLPKVGDNIDMEKIKKNIYSNAKILGKIRFFIQKNKLEYTIKDLKYESFFDTSSLNICLNKLSNYLNAINKIDFFNVNKINEIVKESLPSKLEDYKFICSGHNVIEILGLSLKKYYGTNDSKNVKKEELEKVFRIGYPNSDFIKTNMYKQLEFLLTSASKVS